MTTIDIPNMLAELRALGWPVDDATRTEAAALIERQSRFLKFWKAMARRGLSHPKDAEQLIGALREFMCGRLESGATPLNVSNDLEFALGCVIFMYAEVCAEPGKRTDCILELVKCIALNAMRAAATSENFTTH